MATDSELIAEAAEDREELLGGGNGLEPLRSPLA